MPPAECNDRWTSVNLKDLPRESSEGMVEQVMGVLPAHPLHVIEILIRVGKEDVVISNFVGLLVVEFGAVIGAKMESFLVNAHMILAVKFVRPLHLPRLHQILNNCLQRALLMIPRLTL